MSGSIKNPRDVLKIAAVIAVLLPQRADAQTAAAPSRERLDSVVAEFAEKERLPALSVAIGFGGQVAYAHAIGYADVEHSVLADTATVFRIASVTKPLTATAIMILVEAGKLDLDIPIQQYCPAYPIKEWPLTARHLLSHQGGVRDYNRIERGVWSVRTRGGLGEGSNPHHFATIADAVAVFAADSLAFEPGTRFSYTNVGYLLLGCAIEGASGRSYEDYLKDTVLEPARMHRTQRDDAYAIISNRARPYQMRTEANADFWYWTPTQKKVMRVGELYNSRFEDTSMKLSAGGLLSTPSDLVRFALSFYSGRLVQADTRARMLTLQGTRTGENTGWGYGLTIARRDGETVAGLNGGQPGASALITTLPAKQFVIAATTNRDNVDLRPLTTALARMHGHFVRRAE